MRRPRPPEQTHHHGIADVRVEGAHMVVAEAAALSEHSLPAIPTKLSAHSVQDRALGAAEPMVATEGGLVRGIQTAYGCTQFWGIPYAAPPVGALRWKPPQRAPSWAPVVRDARNDNFSKCLQLPDGGAFNVPPWLEAVEEDVFKWHQRHHEDCLFINIQSPNITARGLRKLPVVVSLHGGSYLSGSGSGTNASEYCRLGVIYVSMNYRLGVFGSLALPELLAEANTTGNYAIQDQRAALEWTARNIHAFGGDPDRVTISGESAGGMAVAAHIASSRSAHLFSQAILMSGNDDSLLLDEAYGAGERFARLAGCGGGRHANVSRLSCLRGADAWALLNEQNYVYNGTMRRIQLPVADGHELPKGELLSDKFRRGDLPRPSKALLAGSNVDDISLFLGFTKPEFTRLAEKQPMETLHTMTKSLPRYLPSANAKELTRVLELYHPDRYGGDARKALYALTTDGYYACPIRRMLNASARSGAPTYGYVFNASISDVAAALGLPESLRPLLQKYVAPWLGAYHGANELLFWSHDDPTVHLAPGERALGSRMRDSWAAFARSALAESRGTGNVSAWPQWNASSGGQYRLLDVPRDRLVHGWHQEQCDFLGRFRFIWNPPTDWPHA